MGALTFQKPDPPADAADFTPAARLAVSLTGYILFRLAAPLLQLPADLAPPLLLSLMLAAALGGIGLPIMLIAALVEAANGWRALLIVAAAGALAWAGGAALGDGTGVVSDIGKILLASAAGIGLARLLREPNILLPAMLFAAFADFVVVNFGTVHQALRPENVRGQELVRAVSAEVPRLHTALPVLTIGPADFLFLGLLLGCAVRFALAPRATAWTFVLVLVVSLVAVPVIGPVPALAPMALAFLVVNWRGLRLSRQEIAASIAVLAGAGALFFAFFYLRR